MTEGRTGERATGTPNTIYDLSSVLFHALEGGASYDQYIQDAEEEGDQELADFFRRVRDEDSMRADEAQRLLAERTPTATTGGRTEGTAVSAEGVAADAPPMMGERPLGAEELPPPRTAGIEEGVLPRTEPASAPPRAEDVPPRRTEEATPTAEEVPSGTPPQAPPGDVQRGVSPEAPPTAGEASRVEQERAGQTEREDRGLIDRAIDKLTGREEQRREGTDRRDQR
jgi:hypothetical protein